MALEISQKAEAMQLTGAQIVIRCLQDEGVEYVFGYPGGVTLPAIGAEGRENGRGTVRLPDVVTRRFAIKEQPRLREKPGHFFDLRFSSLQARKPVAMFSSSLRVVDDKKSAFVICGPTNSFIALS
jgi:hypothetical protein